MARRSARARDNLREYLRENPLDCPGNRSQGDAAEVTNPVANFNESDDAAMSRALSRLIRPPYCATRQCGCWPDASIRVANYILPDADRADEALLIALDQLAATRLVVFQRFSEQLLRPQWLSALRRIRYELREKVWMSPPSMPRWPRRRRMIYSVAKALWLKKFGQPAQDEKKKPNRSVFAGARFGI